MPVVSLPGPGGSRRSYKLGQPGEFKVPKAPFAKRTCYAAPHTVVDALAEYTPGVMPPIDWDATVAFRQSLWKWGIGVAEGMDTSERGPGGLVWQQAQQLIRLSLEAANEVGGAIVCGAGTDQLASDADSLDAIAEAWIEQLDFIEGLGGSAVIRASHRLVQLARGPEDYLDTYGKALKAAQRPVIVHWLGVKFDPTLEGYWGHRFPADNLEVVVTLAKEHPKAIAGIKFSLLEPDLEIRLRRALPRGVKVFTGDDYCYPRLILGDDQGYSHGLLGVLDPLAPVASAALQELERDNKAGFLQTMESTVPLAVRMFEDPAAMYKTGCVFLAYLSGHQEHFRMVSGREGFRSVRHLADLFVLADELGLFPDPELTAHRMGAFLTLSGIE